MKCAWNGRDMLTRVVHIKNTMMMDKFKLLTLVNFVIGSAALSFQVGVLYPWHHQLDDEFKELEKNHERRLQLFHDRKWEKLKEIDTKLESLMLRLNKAQLAVVGDESLKQ
ncbi:hypothetical protein BGW42_002436 [Actinomortierella wolfii]|nr:hypothetical protein BGW42_002436 [Actinomortierella wolfii]